MQLKLSGMLSAILVLAFTGLALAGSLANLAGYQIDFLGFVNNGNGSSTWTYAITADGDEDYALSHWALQIGACYNIVSPIDGSDYTTVTTRPECGSGLNCQASTCKVVLGTDPATGISGIKFEDCSPQLDSEPPLPRTHIFQVTLDREASQGWDVKVGVKAATQAPTGEITGPACPSTAVALRDFAASGQPASAGWSLAAALITMSLVGATIISRRTRPSPKGVK
jgi:hypothetical protein